MKNMVLCGKSVQNVQIFLLLLMFEVMQGEKSGSTLGDDPVVACDGCYALVSEVVQDMTRSTGQTLKTRIETSLAGLCTTDRLRSYKFSPPTQVKSCNSILGRYRHMLSNILQDEFRGGKLATVDQVTERFCFQVITRYKLH